MNRPVYVIGSGCCCSAGLNPHSLWQACCDGMPTAEPRSFTLARNGDDLTVTIPFCSALISDIRDQVFGTFGRDARRLTNASMLAVYAAHQAWLTAPQSCNPARTGLFWGSGSSAVAPIEQGYTALLVEHRSRISPMTVADSMASAPAAAIASLLRISGPSFATASACASSAHAIAMAAMMIASGSIDHAIAGGSELLSDPSAVISWHSTGVLSGTRMRPFHQDADGINLGDGAGAILLTADPAGAFARVGPTSYSTGAKDVMAPMVDAVFQCLSPILDHPASADEPIVVNCHATGTRVGDIAEKDCFSRLSERSERTLLCSTTKAVTGHTMSASGILEAIISLETLNAQQVPMVHKLCAGEWSPQFMRPIPALFSRIYSASFGFGGMNVLLSFEQL